MTKKLLSIVTPVYNEEDNIDLYYKAMTKVIDNIKDYNFEIIITDNCSTDRTFVKLKKIAAHDKRVRVFRFSKNFGYQKSIWTGYVKARGESAIEFDCDLQDPPELLPKFISEWEKGNKIVYGIRSHRSESKYITLLRKLFYRLINYISDNDLPNDAGDFMLLDRAILDHLHTINDHNLYLRGLVFSFGYKRKGIAYKRAMRVAGKSKFPFRKMLRLAIDGVVSQSVLPLKIATYIGVGIALVTLIMSMVYVVLHLLHVSEWPAGFTTTTVLLLLSISINSIFLGVIGEYLARIYNQTKILPMTIIEDEIESS